MKKIKGFTLIELLIVIAILGALAAGLLAALDPLEQIKKGADTSLRSQAEAVYGAIISQYGKDNAFPTSLVGVLTLNASGGGRNLVTELISGGELKPDFYTVAGSANLAKIVVSTSAAGGVIVCYNPTSKSFRDNPSVAFNNIGVNLATCPSGTNAACWGCLK